MRKYQKKSVNKIAVLYQSNDPLKWVYIASIMGVNRPMNKREARIFWRRFKHGIDQMVQTIAKVFKGVATTVARAVEGLTAFAKATEGMPKMADIRITPTVAELDNAPAIRGVITDIKLDTNEVVKHDTSV